MERKEYIPKQKSFGMTYPFMLMVAIAMVMVLPSGFSQEHAFEEMVYTLSFDAPE